MEMLLAIGATAAVGVTSHRVTSRPCRATPACRSTSWWYSALAVIRAVGSDARRALRDTYAGHSRAPIGGKPDPWSAEVADRSQRGAPTTRAVTKVIRFSPHASLSTQPRSL